MPEWLQIKKPIKSDSPRIYFRSILKHNQPLPFRYESDKDDQKIIQKFNFQSETQNDLSTAP